MFSCSLFFFIAAHFHLALVATSISHFVTTQSAKKVIFTA